jgi:glucose/arabinose dehydrogenase
MNAIASLAESVAAPGDGQARSGVEQGPNPQPEPVMTSIRPALILSALSLALLSACLQAESPARGPDPALTHATPAPTAAVFDIAAQAQFAEPWAMAFLPDGRLLVTEKRGALKLFDPKTKRSGEITGVPKVAYGGQGGFGDVALHPDFASNRLVYLSYAETGMRDTRGAVVARAVLSLDENGGGALGEPEVIWRQTKISGMGHYSHRLLFADGHLFVSSGDRQHFEPAQDMDANLGKILRLTYDGQPAPGNPFADEGKVASQIWSLGHRNPLGIDVDAQGRLWNNEMGPQGGDELNLVQRGANYGYPIVSNGDHYGGRNIPDHDTRPEFATPALWWTPVISPSSLHFYRGALFPWRGQALIGGLSSQALIRVEIDGDTAKEAARYDFGRRIRAVEEDTEGALWLLEDGSGDNGGRLLKLTPRTAD